MRLKDGDIMNRCIKCSCYTEKQFCDNCMQLIQKEINSTKSSFDRFKKGKKYKCKSGIYVRSQAERTIADFLFDNKITFIYEPEIKYGEYNLLTSKLEGKIIHPDFLIPGPTYFKGKLLQNVYIEFWGMDNDDYNESKEYKIEVYEKHNSTLINTYFEDIYDYIKSLSYKLYSFEYHKINFLQDEYI